MATKKNQEEIKQEEINQQEALQDDAKKNEEERVLIHLFKDNDRYKNDVTVAVNGKLFVIQRGVDVYVPKSVKEVLDNSQKQDLFAEKQMEEFHKQYESMEKNT